MPWSESADLASVYLSRWCLEERWIREQRSCGHQKNRGAFFLCLSMYSLTLRTQLHLSLSSLFSHSAVHLSVTSVFSGLHLYVFLWVMLRLVIWGSWVGYASRRAMLQQLHGVAMYSHDEHHISAPYCWSERGKGASATNPSTAVLVIHVRPSVTMSVRHVGLFHVKHAFE